MKTTLLLTTLALSVGATQAATTVLDLELSRTEDFKTTSSEGTISITAFNDGATGGATQSMTYTISGLTLDSVGTADDSITITMGLFATSSTGTVAGMGAAFGAWGVEDGTGNSSLVEDDETLTFSIQSSAVNLGAGATESANITFNGFAGFGLLNVGSGETFNVINTLSNDAAGVLGTSLSTHPDNNSLYLYTFTGTEDSFTVQGDVGAMRYGLVSGGFTVETTSVPEPSSSSLIGLVGLGFILRRRRS